MKKLFAIVAILATLLLGGCVAPGFNMSGSIGIGPQGGYGQQYGQGVRTGNGVSVPVFSPTRGYIGNGYFENRCQFKNDAGKWMKGCR